MDGTVVNSGKMLTKTINSVRKHFNLKPMDTKEALQALNDPDINSAQFFYNTKIFTQEHTQLFEKYYHRNCIEEIELYEGMNEVLNSFHKEYDFAVATNAHTQFAHKILHHLNVKDYFKTIIGADLVPNPKPSPDMLVQIIKQYNHPKEKTMLIGDSLKDKRAAIAAGISHTIVGWGFTKHNNEKYYIHKVDELYELLEKF